MAGPQLDDALEFIGKYGRYQIVTSVIVTILGAWFPAWHMMGLIFMADKPESYECVRWSADHGGAALDAGGMNAASLGGADQENTVTHDFSNQTSPDASNLECTAEDTESASMGSLCTEWEYYAVYNESTIVTDFDLVCDRTILAETAQSIFLVGMLVGSVVFGYLSDVFGRKIILLGTCLANGVFGIVVAFLWSYTSVVILWFLIGMFAQGYNQVQFVMIMELFPTNCRTLAGSLNSMFWGLGVVALTPIAYALRNWRHMQLAISAPCLLAIPLWPILDESARWLLSKGRIEDAQKILHKMARWNGVAPPSGGFLIKETTIDPPSSELSNSLDPVLPTPSEKECTFLDVLRTRRVLLNLCIIYFAWFVSLGTYYGASLNSSNLAGNKYTNFLFLGLAEVPGYIIIHFTMTWWGRRPSLCLFFLVSGAASIVTAFLPEQTADGTDLTIVITVVAMLVKLCIVCTYAVNLICCTEILPTSVRNIGFGVGAVWGSVGLITAPFVIYLDDFASFLPLSVFGGLCILAAILVPILPETGNKPLPESLEDARNIGKKVSKTPEPNTAVCTPTTDAKIEDGSKVDAL